MTKMKYLNGSARWSVTAKSFISVMLLLGAAQLLFLYWYWSVFATRPAVLAASLVTLGWIAIATWKLLKLTPSSPEQNPRTWEKIDKSKILGLSGGLVVLVQIVLLQLSNDPLVYLMPSMIYALPLALCSFFSSEIGGLAFPLKKSYITAAILWLVVGLLFILAHSGSSSTFSVVRATLVAIATYSSAIVVGAHARLKVGPPRQ